MYDLIVYQVINFKIPRGDKMINKRYFQKVKTINNISKKEVNVKYRELKSGLYRDWCYIINDVEHGTVDWFIERQNAKSEKAYHDYVLRGYK